MEYNLETGDLIFFNEPSSSIFTRIIYGTDDVVSCGIVLKNPTFISPLLKGIYIWSCTNFTQTEICNMNSQIEPLDSILKKYPNYSLRVRKCPDNARFLFSDSKLKLIHSKLHNNEPQNLYQFDWFDLSIRNIAPNKSLTSSVFCCYILVFIGIIASNTDYLKITNDHFTSTDNYITWQYKYYQLQRI